MDYRMKRFLEYYKLMESIFVPVNAEQYKERKKQFIEVEKKRFEAINVMTNEDGDEVLLTDLLGETYGFDVFDYRSEKYNIENVKNWIIEPYGDNSLFDWVLEAVYDSTKYIYSQHGLDVNEYKEQFNILQENIESKLNFNWKRVIPDEVLFIIKDFNNIVEGYDSGNEEQTIKETGMIFEDVKTYGFTMEEVIELYKESKYGGNVSVGIVGNPMDASQGFIEGQIVLIMEFEYYVIGKATYKYVDTANRLSNMVDTSVGYATETDDWTWK
jgi:hypothetical protein